MKIDSVSTDVVWAHGGTGGESAYAMAKMTLFFLAFSNKIVTSARNGEIIMWDIQKSGPTKFGKLLSSVFGLPLDTFLPKPVFLQHHF